MQFQLSGHQLEVTQAMRAHAESRLDRLTRLDPKLISLSIVLSIDNIRHLAEGNLQVNGTRLHAEAGESDMYASIDVLFEKLVHQLQKHREKITDKHQREVRDERQYG